MSHVFYDHLIPWQKIESTLAELEFSKEEHIEIIELIDETMHAEILFVICSFLPSEKHEEFLLSFEAAPHDERHIAYLQEHSVSDISIQIQLRAKEVIEELLMHIQKARESVK